jgi:hypothetical protein
MPDPTVTENAKLRALIQLQALLLDAATTETIDLLEHASHCTCGAMH